MIKADGEYVKIYLLILRLMNQNLPVQIDQLADTLELTQKDIIRALKYWEKEGLLELEDSSAAKAQNEQPAGQGMLAGQQAGQTAGEADQGRQAGQTDSMAGGGVSHTAAGAGKEEPQYVGDGEVHQGHGSGTDSVYGRDVSGAAAVCV